MENIEKIEFRPIGIIRSPFKEPKGMPIQPIGAKGIEGKIEIFPEFAEGLKDLDGFSHIILIYHLHLSKGYKMLTYPFLEKNLHGVFSTRSPHRPNQIGLSIVRLEKIEENILTISNVDIVDGTPLLDIKPFVKEFDCFDMNENYRIGWLKNRVENSKQYRTKK
ncbi:MAG: tRNA (N6-threonylcarbamoyladenosine(37)-N6)-methyltransferase TrmO [Candidatus Cloacimonadota bacterium]|nr:MAG: tRNA (N6-threonylcarbamoyladenosine(37)-N6)-methyltransferase TrmO [Candidatus Cloacimonadota bacterium]